MDVGNNILVIPRHQVFLRFIDVPSIDNSEIKCMITLQAMKEVPFPKDEIVMGYRRLGSFEDGFSSVMLAIAKKKMLTEIAKGNEKNGIRPEAIMLETELLYLLLCKKGIINEKGVGLIIDIGKDYSELMIVDKLKPVFSRALKNSDTFLEEVNYSIMAYKKDRKAHAPDNVAIVHGANIDIKNIKTAIGGNFTIPVNFYELDKDLIGQALSAEINLMPVEIKEKNIKARQKKEMVFTYFLAALVLILSVVFIHFRIYQKEKLLLAVSLRLKALQSHVDKLEGYLEKVHVFEKAHKKAEALYRIISGSYSAAPRNISLSGFNYDGERAFYLKGMAKNMSDILIFVRKLEDAGYFDSVEIKHATKNIIRGEELTDFNIQCGVKI